MRILFLNNFYYPRGGSERILFEEMRLLRAAGHEVAVFSRGHENNQHAEYARFFPPPLETERFGFSLTNLSTVGELVYSRTARRGLREVIRRFRPDVAHAHNIYGRLSLSVLDELKSAGIPVVMTLHDLKLLCPSYLMLRDGTVCERCRGKRFHRALLARCHKGSYPASAVYAFESWLNHALGKYRFVSRFVAPSQFLRNKCIEYGWDEGRIAYIPNFVDLAASPQKKGAHGYLLYLGRLSREKGVASLLEAYQLLDSPPRLVVAGDGPESTALRRKAVDASLPVTFTGHMSADQIRELLSGAQAMVMPSQWYENAPLSLLEAFAAGTPVLASRIGGIPEMIDEGTNGYLFEPGNPSSLAAGIQRFLSLPAAARSEMEMAARAKVERHFHERRHRELLLELYRTVGRTP
ncbi:glycosyltransferase family 4 protein [Geomesophilobacter sediminis]|uniref:Glycosyltransferase family 4 protein n=1 Tax=Geomesophilobacter sediminis TaxID=2798584 RepID=A0A8J7LY82_9BACT|nr:glycosyltransferase family 4 protein [Geomesophilobacter sediminis]MBJ6724267.1 glycosyltransferase family 4 protein [Geomesophilobacter sediminis]